MAKTNVGWIRLHRSSFNNRLYFEEPFTRWQAWCDLLLLANHTDGYFRVRGIKVPVKRGQLGWTSTKLADRWQWSRGKVGRFLNELQDEHQITQQKDNVTTLISILKYEEYQSDGTAKRATNGHIIEQQNVQQNVQQTDINNNEEEESNNDLIKEKDCTDFESLKKKAAAAFKNIFNIDSYLKNVSDKKINDLSMQFANYYNDKKIKNFNAAIVSWKNNFILEKRKGIHFEESSSDTFNPL